MSGEIHRLSWGQFSWDTEKENETACRAVLVLCLSRHSSSQRASLESEELPIGTGKLVQEENLSTSLQDKFFLSYWAAKPWLMSPKNTTLTWQNHLRPIICWPWPHLTCVSVSPSLVSSQGILRLKDQKTSTKKEIMLLSPSAVALYDLKGQTVTMNTLYHKGGRKYGNRRRRNWIMTVPEWVVVDGRDLETFGKHSDTGMMVSVKKIVRNITRGKRLIRPNQA